MNYLDGNKCLDEILESVTPEDEKTFFLNLEYLKSYTGWVIGRIHKDWFGNIFDVFLTTNKNALSEDYIWNNFEEAKEKLEGKENPSSKCFHLKEGLKIAFEHEMALSECYPETINEPKWVALYNDWTDQKNAYKKQFLTEKELNAYSNFISDVIKGVQVALNKTH